MNEVRYFATFFATGLNNPYQKLEFEAQNDEDSLEKANIVAGTLDLQLQHLEVVTRIASREEKRTIHQSQ